MLNPDYKEMLSILLKEKVDFFLVGAYALAAHGLPRATGDMDIFIRCSNDNAKKIYKALAEFGAPLEKYTLSDFESPGMIFQIGVIPRRIDIINYIDGVSFDEALEDYVTINIENLKIPILSKAKLIKNKEATGREKDRVDAQNLRNS
jgi:hypothetical protein